MSRFLSVYENRILAVLGLAGAIVFFLLYPQLSPTSRLELDLHKGGAQNVAAEFLSSEGYDHNGFASNAFLSVDNRLNSYFRAQGVDEGRRQRAKRHFPFAQWEVIFRHPDRNERFHVHVAGSGRIVQFRHHVPRDVEGARIPREQAEQIAGQFLEHQFGVSAERYDLVDAQTVRMDSRTDHSFVWEERDHDAGGIRLRLQIFISGDHVAGWERAVQLPEYFTFEFTRRSSTAELFDSVAVQVIVMLCVLLAIGVLVFRFRAGEVSLRNATIIALMFMALFLVLSAAMGGWAFESLLRQSMTAENPAFFTTLVYIFIPVAALIIGATGWVVWAGGESVTRELWPEKLQSLDGYFGGHFLTREAGTSILRGFAIAGTVLGLWFGAMLVVLSSPEIWPVVSEYERLLLSVTVPYGIPVLYAFYAALLGIAYAILFVFSIAKKGTRRTWLAVLVSVLLFDTFFEYTFPVFDRWVQSAVAVAIGPLFYVLYLRYDVLTILAAVFVVAAVPPTAMYLVQPGDVYIAGGVVSIGVLSGILVFGLYAVARGQTLNVGQVTPPYFKYITERERMKMELDIARKAQIRMLPDRIPEIEGLQVAALSTPSREVGGDYYDLIALEDGRLCALVGDVSGKGMPAALYMTLMKGFITQAVTTDSSAPRHVLSTVNRNFFQAAERNMFVTVFYAIIDPRSRTIDYCRAGHNPGILYSSETASVEMLWPPGLGIGLERGGVFESTIRQETIRADAGDVIVVYSDGLVEGRNEAGEMYGEDRLITIVRTFASGSAEGLLDAICEDYRRFAGKADPDDDLTCVVVKFDDETTP